MTLKVTPPVQRKLTAVSERKLFVHLSAKRAQVSLDGKLKPPTLGVRMRQ